MGSANLVNLDGYAILVPAAVGTHDVGQLGRRALWADATSRSLQAPVRRAATAGFGFAGLALWNCHRSSLSTERANPSHFFGFIGLKVHESEFIKCSPARVDRCLAVTRGLVAVDPAVGTQAQTALSTEGSERQIKEYRVVRQWREIDEIILYEVGVVVFGPSRVDETLNDIDHADAEHRIRTPSAHAVPGSLDVSARAQSPAVTLQGDVHPHGCFRENIGFCWSARWELVLFIKRSLKISSIRRRHVAQQLSHRDEVGRGHGG
jgi:hypothetical protein